MLDAVMASIQHADALVMAAAVADFRPAAPADQKIKKEAGVPEIHLAPTADILAAVAEFKEQTGLPRVTVGFAAESQSLIENATAKLVAKKLDMIVANNIGSGDAGFAVDTNRVTLLFADGRREDLPLMEKVQVAGLVMDYVLEKLLALDSNEVSK
jgi:phosphopantothenoylcysteine decarboxylase/phosphopantothenate--cysteine ligase